MKDAVIVRVMKRIDENTWASGEQINLTVLVEEMMQRVLEISSERYTSTASSYLSVSTDEVMGLLSEFLTKIKEGKS